MARYPQGILVSCEIPWDDAEQLLEDVFRAEIRMVLENFQHLYIFGTAGEGYAVDTARFQQIVRIFHEETRGEGVQPMVGIIGLSTANMVERIAFAHSLIDLAHRLGLRTVAEWVKDEKAAELLRGWGCDYLQGELIGLASTDRPWAVPTAHAANG